MAEKSSFMGKKSSFKGKNRVLSFLVKSSFPQNAQKKAWIFSSLEKTEWKNMGTTQIYSYLQAFLVRFEGNSILPKSLKLDFPP